MRMHDSALTLPFPAEETASPRSFAGTVEVPTVAVPELGAESLRAFVHIARWHQLGERCDLPRLFELLGNPAHARSALDDLARLGLLAVDWSAVAQSAAEHFGAEGQR